MSQFLYNPDKKPKKQLIAEFVVRNQIVDDIMHDLETSDMQTPEQHYLLVGQRGTGKTTLLHRIKYAIEDSPRLNTWLIPVIFGEEQYNVSELANLWENVGHILEDDYHFENAYEEMEQHSDKENFEERCYDILEKHLTRHKKKLVLLIDNVGDLLKKIEDKEVRRLREILQTKSHIRLIGGSPFYLDSILDYKQPFFEFFKVKRLEGLSRADIETLLLKLGEVYGEKNKIEVIIKETPERIETLRVLTGGVPRTIALMFRVFVDHEHESSIKDLERILDAVTPLYKHRMDDLPKQQQKIVDAVAKNWDAISVKELKERVRLDSKIISAQLRQLEKNQVIEKRETDTKNHLYLLKERFFNIWYLMRYGRKFDKQRVVWYVKFLECLCSKSELEERITAFINKVKNKELNESSIQFFSLVYTSINDIGLETRINLQDNVLKEIGKDLYIDSEEVLKLAEEKVDEEKFSEAFALLRRLSENTFEKKFKIAIILFKIPNIKRGELVSELSSKTNNLNKIDIVLCRLIALMLLIQGGIVEIIDEDSIDVIRNLFTIIKKLMEDESEDLKVEDILLDRAFGSFIIGDKVNLAYQFFEDDENSKWKNRYEINYIVLKYFVNNQDENILLKLPDEKKDIVIAKIKDVSEQRSKFEAQVNKLDTAQ